MQDKIMKSKKIKKTESEKESSKVSFYPAWCKRCGNCVAFCPSEALQKDEWGYPYLANPEKCISCHMCEKLCPDFAIAVSEESPESSAKRASAGQSLQTPGSMVSQDHSPERIAPKSSHEEDENAKE
jgi:2-oxoglutarate ferredoxin oxidoreductase subunit delta